MSIIKFTKFKLFLLVAVALLIGVFLGNSYQTYRFKNFSFLKEDKVNDILDILEERYVDTINVDTMENLAINQILSKLDPHTIYLEPNEAKELNQTLEGNFEGIGIEYYNLNDTLLITNVREGGPAQKAGLLEGDKIVKINGQLCNRLGNAKSVHLMRGEKGTGVKVSFFRDTDANLHELTIIREQIFVSSIDVASLINNHIGYIKISNFGANTFDDFVSELQILKRSGVTNLVLDLRGNGGGYLEAATALIDQFLGKGKLIVYTQGLHEPRTNYTATEGGIFETGNIAVLIDEQTASASEIVAGALQDWGRGIIIGRRSFGKGLVQQQFPFSDGSAINLTVARYYTPSGRSIQKPYKNGRADYENELNKRLKHGEYTSLDSTLADSDAVNLKQKFKAPSGKIVYSGGGIIPDIFIPADTIIYKNKFYEACINKSLIQGFAYSKLLPVLNKDVYKSDDDFIKNYELTPSQYHRFIAMANKYKIEGTTNEIEASKTLIQKGLKCTLIHYFYGDKSLYKFLNAEDNFVKKAVEYLESK